MEKRLREAETYESMGLLDEALSVYKEIIDAFSIEEAKKRQIQRRMDELKEKIKDGKKRYVKDIGPEDLRRINEALDLSQTPSEILESAEAFKELGLLDRAISEYEKLLCKGYSISWIIPNLMQILIQRYSVSEATEKVRDIIRKNINSKDFRYKEAYLVLAEYLDSRGSKDMARNLYEELLKEFPQDPDIKKRMEILKISIVSGSRYDYLIQNHIISPEQLKEAFYISKRSGKSIDTVLMEHFHIKKEDIGRSLSHYYRCPFKGFEPNVLLPSELVVSIKKSFLLHEHWVPLRWSKDGVEVLVDNPNDPMKIDHIRALLKTDRIKFYVGLKEDIERYIELIYERREEEERERELFEDLSNLPKISLVEEEEEEIEEEWDEESGEVVRAVDHILLSAFRQGASDIHIEPSPQEKRTAIRFRLDGVCQEYISLPLSMARPVLSRLKIMAGLDISERRLPQDGKIKFRRKGITPFELRLATIPTVGGYEDAVLRILAKAGAMKLEDMGMTERNLSTLKRLITQPYGIVLVVGPTGSGKTTTLHACLDYINTPKIKIWTAEDPVEITQKGMRQVEVKPKIGLDFARVMRAFLRADPDVIMIGEMRDKETASIAVEASLTGHLVFSTLHTNSAPETITRLLDMGINPLNFADSLLGVLAQRLVRRLCKDCREPYHPDEEEFKSLVMEYGKEFFKNTGITYSKELVLYRPKGCNKCMNTGYRGRMGIHELMEGTATIKRLIKKEAETETIRDAALKEGMTTLKQDGILKVLSGETDMDEVRRVCVT